MNPTAQRYQVPLNQLSKLPSLFLVAPRRIEYDRSCQCLKAGKYKPVPQQDNWESWGIWYVVQLLLSSGRSQELQFTTTCSALSWEKLSQIPEPLPRPHVFSNGYFALCCPHAPNKCWVMLALIAELEFSPLCSGQKDFERLDMKSNFQGEAGTWFYHQELQEVPIYLSKLPGDQSFPVSSAHRDRQIRSQTRKQHLEKSESASNAGSWVLQLE